MSTNPNPDPRLAVCSWSLEPTDPGQLVEQIHETGLRRTQLDLSPLAGESAWRDTGRVLSDAGIEAVSGMMVTVGEDYSTLESIRETGGVVPDERWHENLEHARRVADAAADLGLSIVSFHAGFIPHDPADAGFAKLADRLTTIADLFHGHGCVTLLETGQESAASLNALLDHIDHPQLAVNFDPANMILYGMGDPIAALRQLLPRVRQVHLKDARPTKTPGTWGEEVPVGEGAVDWPAFVSVLDEGGYTGDLVIEREAGTQRVADVRRAVDHITPLLQ
jgi:sugar phosphate isomerase/epimerase